MIKTSIFLLLSLVLAVHLFPPDFLEEQQKHERVRAAFAEKGQLLENKLKQENLSLDKLNILIRAYKAEKQLELYAKGKHETVYRKLGTYPICKIIGEPGPKRKQGDQQIPEGFYHIDRFHPGSKFHLALGLNYPNLSDRRKSKATDLGGDIFIHGACITAGCLPMTDNRIKEIYLFAVHARQSGQQQIPVYIFPFRMTDVRMETYKTRFKNNKALLSFWENLKTGHDLFEKNNQELQVKVDREGNYIF